MRHVYILFVVLALASASMDGQSPAQPAPDARFEVASVKANTSVESGGSLRRQPGGRVNAINMPLRRLIGFAYQVPQFLLVGGPDWAASERFDIAARLDGDPPVTAPGSSSDPLILAMRALLADRFHLEVHRESREGDIYALETTGRNGGVGPALKPSTQDCSAEAVQARRADPGAQSPNLDGVVCGMLGGPGRIRFAGLPLGRFATALSGQLGRSVVDRTGLPGTWDFELTFVPAPARDPAPLAVDLTAAQADAPSIFTAIQEQLGLKLEPAKGSLDVVVIDKVERPTPD